MEIKKVDKYLFSIPLTVDITKEGKISSEVLELFKKKKRALSDESEFSDLSENESVIKDLKKKKEYKLVEGEDRVKVFACLNAICKPSKLRNTNLEEKKFLGWMNEKMKGSPISQKKRKKVKLAMLEDFRKSNAKSAKEYEGKLRSEMLKKTANQFKEYTKLIIEP